MSPANSQPRVWWVKEHRTDTWHRAADEDGGRVVCGTSIPGAPLVSRVEGYDPEQRCAYCDRVSRDDRNLIRRLVLALRPVEPGARRPRSALVEDALGCPSDTAADLCARLDLDPGAMIDGPDAVSQ